MKDIQICVGSSCHLKGSYDIIECTKKTISEYYLEDKVILRATFCLGKCGVAGVSIKVDDEIITGVTVSNFQEVFKKYVLDRI